MTRKTNSKFLTIKQLLVFILAIVMCLSLFMATACKEDEDDSANTIPEFSYSDNADGEIKNPSFTFGTQAMDYEDYPKTSVDGWTFSKVATSKSGVIDVSNNGWTELMSRLYKDDGLLKYVMHINNFDDNDIRDIIRNGNTSVNVTTDEIKQFIIDNYFLQPDAPHPGINKPVKYAFLNPGTHANDLDNKVYMLNNYVAGDFGYGCVQSLISSSEITLNKGEYAKVSVWVKTANLNVDNTSKNYGEPVGANILVKNTFNGSYQSNYGVYNITDTNWTQYSFYLRADDVFETKFILQLGLGYDNCAVEGTVYFDDIDVELLTAEEYQASIAGYTDTQISTISYNNKDAKPSVKASNYSSSKLYLYDMRVNLAEVLNSSNSSKYSQVVNFHNDKTDTTYYNFTQYNEGNLNGNITNLSNAVELTHKSNLDAPYGLTNGLEIKLQSPSSYTIKLDNNGSPFSLNGESYSAITFFVKNNLNKLFSSNITINVQDKYGSVITERPSVATISEISDEWTKYTITVKNNFDEDKYVTPREFYLEIVIGPDQYTNIIDNYAFGSVTIASPIISTGKTYQYVDDTNEIETDGYQYYNLLSDTSAGSTALYAGFSQDYTADETNAETYPLVVAPSNIGQILDNPANPKNFTGIESGHYYISGNEQDTISINNNQYAGLINSKYLNNYKSNTNLSNIDTALNYTNTNKNVQPLMIKTQGKSYGFISDNYLITAQSYAKVSVNVRVYDATAYVYLVDTSLANKQVMKLDTFTVNTQDGEFNNYGETISKELFFVVDNTMLEDNGWVTVEFYIATGATDKEFRIELWNGARDNTNALSQDGYTFFNDISVSTTTAFNEPTRWQDALTEPGSPLFNQGGNIKNATDLIAYQRELTALEVKYNSEENEKISYKSNYVWAKTSKMIYAIYNTIDPIEVDPYSSVVEDDTDSESSLYETDPATFWMSLSSIIIGVALIIAIIMLFIKNIRRRRKANKNDAKSHYTVRSRTKKPSKAELEEVDVDVNIDETTTDQTTESEQTLDSYVYGDVQDFGEEKNEND